jgi:hypothetical protein
MCSYLSEKYFSGSATGRGQKDEVIGHNEDSGSTTAIENIAYKKGES